MYPLLAPRQRLMQTVAPLGLCCEKYPFSARGYADTPWVAGVTWLPEGFHHLSLYFVSTQMSESYRASPTSSILYNTNQREGSSRRRGSNRRRVPGAGRPQLRSSRRASWFRIARKNLEIRRSECRIKRKQKKNKKRQK
jgi:hypothetical protein